MVDFEQARTHMVDNQVRTAGVTDGRVLQQLRAIPREDFVPANRRDIAYADDIHWFGPRGSARFMAAPATLAKLLQLADIGPDDIALDIGAAAGYSTASIAGLAASVTGFEPDATLAATAAANLAALGITNANIVSGAIAQLGTARFDVIVVQGALDSVPDSFLAALKDGGRLVALIRAGGVSVANVLVKTAREVTVRSEFNAFLPPFFGAAPNEEFVF